MSDGPNLPPPNHLKRSYVSKLLEGGIAQLLINARVDGVVVPPEYRYDERLILNFSWRYANTSMYLDESGIHATLSFSGQLHKVSVPWEAVLGGGRPKDKNPDGVRFMVFVPEVLGARVEAPPAKPALRLIQGGKATGSNSSDDDSDDSDDDGSGAA